MALAERPAPENRKRKAASSSVSPEKRNFIAEAGKRRGSKTAVQTKEKRIWLKKTKRQKAGGNSAAAESKLQSGATHARKAAEDLKSAAGAVAEEYRGRAEEVWNDASYRVRSFQDDAEQYVRENPTKAVFTALGIGFVLGLIFRR